MAESRTGCEGRCEKEFRERLEAAMARRDGDPAGLIPLLQEVQREFGYLPEEGMKEVARRLRIPETRVYGVATFYSQFTMRPRGENVITVCCGTACHVRGGDKIISDISRRLGIKPGETTPDGKITLEKAACFGSCALAPVVIVNEKVHGQQTPRISEKIMEDIG